MRFDLADNTFAETTARPDDWAVIGSDRSLRWHELATEARAWARIASHNGFSADTPVIVRGHKEAGFFVAMAGALLLRAPFVPVDTIYPLERMQRIARTLDAHAFYDVASASFTTLREGPPRALKETSLAYVLFTSGTTGEPKGVQIGRESVASLVDWMAADFALGDAPVFLNQAPFSFDLSMYEVFGTLALGGTIVMASRTLAAPGAGLLPRLASAGLTTWVSTPSFAQQQLLDPAFSQAGLPTLRTFLFCGEVLPVPLAKHLRKRFPDATVINTYGPTEATVATTWVIVDDALIAAHSPLPIGRPKRDSDVIVVDGELCIAGPHVMRGYLNRADLNETRLFEFDGKRIFRTGDLGSIDNTGLLFCHGRMDDQIKMGGYRIELMEIDAALRTLPGVANAAAVPLRRSDGSVARVVGFVELPGGHAVPDDWKRRLAAHLPPYMVPSELLGCDAIPVSVNFKIDRVRLAADYHEAHLKAVNHGA